MRILKSKVPGDGFTLIETVDGKDKDGKPKKQESFSYYGCLYQALHGFQKKTINRAESLSHARSLVNLALDDIAAADKIIKDNFSIVVHKEK